MNNDFALRRTDKFNGSAAVFTTDCTFLWRAVLCSGMLCAVMIGCGDPVTTIPAARKQQIEARAKAATTDPVVLPTGGVSAPARLHVGIETIERDDIWKFHLPELRARRTELPPDQFARLVNEQSARLVADRIAEALLYQRASLRVNSAMEQAIDRQVDADIREFVTENHGGVQRRYEKQLEADGLTLETVRARKRREVIIGAYLETEVRPRVVEPTRDELYRIYQANLENWRKPTRRNMSLIEIRFLDRLEKDITEPTREQMDAARAAAKLRAETALSEIRAGADFADVARRSSDGLSAQDGGKWGWVKPDGVRERFRPAVDEVYKLREEQVSGIIEAPDAFFIVRCDAAEGGAEPEFEAVQPELRERFFVAAYNKLIRELIDDLREKAKVDLEDVNRFHASVVAAAMNSGT